jgi:hypothetical protein
MTLFRLLVAEIRYRKLNFVLSLAAVVVAVMLFVAGPMLVDGYQQQTQSELSEWQERVAEAETLVQAAKAEMGKVESQTQAELARLADETRKAMLGMGFNLVIVPSGTNMSDFWAADFADRYMPQEYVDRLAKDRRLTLVTHLVATLQGKIEWEKQKVLLAGYLPETPQAHMGHQKPLGYDIRPGTALLGHELGRGRKEGEKITVLGREFTIARLLPELGSKEDISIAVNLSDAQALLDKPGRINQIMALECRCPNADLALIRRQLAGVLPQTQISEFRSIAVARAEQRALVEAKQKEILAGMQENLRQREQIFDERRQILDKMETSRTRMLEIIETLTDVVTPLVVLASAVWVGLLAMANVRQRRTEIGLLRALGKGSARIATLFLGKAVLTGAVGAVLGVLLGAWTARWLGTRALEVSADYFPLRLDILLCALLGAPLVSAVASYLPTLTALVQDPAVVLREP